MTDLPLENDDSSSRLSNNGKIIGLDLENNEKIVGQSELADLIQYWKALTSNTAQDEDVVVEELS